MDPNAALESLLRGHMMLDHAEALCDWLARGGFAPRETLLPADCHAAFALLRADTMSNTIPVRVKADRAGLWMFDVLASTWRFAFTFAELARLEDSEF